MDGSLVVTNDYRGLSTSDRQDENELTTTSCARYDRTRLLLRERKPRTASDCLGILRDPHVRMGITAQHMVLQASTGNVTVLRGGE